MIEISLPWFSFRSVSFRFVPFRSVWIVGLWFRTRSDTDTGKEWWHKGASKDPTPGNNNHNKHPGRGLRRCTASVRCNAKKMECEEDESVDIRSINP